MAAAEHLADGAKICLDLSDEDRIDRVRQPRWIGYSKALVVLQKLEGLLRRPTTHRMPNLLLIGSTNNGKSKLVRRFADQHPPNDNPAGEGIKVPILYVQAPTVPDEARLYTNILDKLFAPQRAHDTAGKKQSQVLNIFRRIGVKMLIIDDIHNVIAGHLEKQRQFLNTIRFLGNELQIPIVAAGTREAYRAIHTDMQLVNRFEPVVLERWQLNQEYRKLLASFERILPLREPSNLAEPSLASKLLTMSEGTIGDLSMLLEEAAAYAIKAGTEKITKRVLDAVDWTMPSERRRQGERVI